MELFKKLTALEDAVGHCSLRNKSFSASKLHWKAKNYIKGFGFFYNLVAIYYTNSKFILNNKTWYIYCIYIYIKKKKERQREMLKDLGYMHTFPQILAQINMKGKLSHPV